MSAEYHITHAGMVPASTLPGLSGVSATRVTLTLPGCKSAWVSQALLSKKLHDVTKKSKLECLHTE